MNIFIRAYLKSNFGDDLFIKILLERYPEHHFFIFGGEEYKEILIEFSNFTLFNPNSYKNEYNFLEKILRRVSSNLYKKVLKRKILKLYKFPFSKTDLFLTIGGSLFVNDKKIRINSEIEFYKTIIEQFSNSPKFILGSNFGPYIQESFRNEHEFIFKNFTDVCFRDLNSKKVFENLENVRFAPDIVFNLKYKAPIAEKNSIGFSVVPPRKYIGPGVVDEVGYKAKYVELIKFYQKKNYSVKLFSFCSIEGDEAYINELLNSLDNKKNVSVSIYKTNINIFLDEFAKVETLVCGRFHAMIIGIILKRNIIPICYSNKMFNVLNDINFAGLKIPIEDFAKLDTEVFHQSVKNTTVLNYDPYITESDNQFRLLDKILNP